MGRITKSTKRAPLIAAVALCVAGLICCIIFLVTSFKKADLSNDMTNLQNSASVAASELQSVPSIFPTANVDIPEKNLNFNKLQKTNPDIYAWIYIPGTSVDYPVLQHPTDDTFYLEHNIDGSAGLPGCIYSELLNGKSFDDRNTVLYGHNMRNGSMFATLHRYADKDFFDTNRYIYIYTEKGTYVYEIFAAYTYSDIHLLKGLDITSDEKFADYLESVLAIRGMGNNIDNSLNIDSSDRIVTLSTCTSNDTRRFLVQGVLLNGRER